MVQLVLKIVLAIITAPYRRAFTLYTWQPLRKIRAAKEDRKTLVLLVRDWKNDKYAELQSVQVAATFCGGATISSLPWSRTMNATWIADALWFSALICAISAIITSIQTKSILDDLPAREHLDSTLPESEVLRMQRTILRYKRTPGIKHWVMAFIWQFPSMTMAYAWCSYLAGLTLYICTPFIRRASWQDQHKVAVVYLTTGFIGLVTYISATLFVYAGEKEYEHSISSTRANTQTSRGTSPAAMRVTTQHVTEPSIPRACPVGAIFDEMDPVQIARAKGQIGFALEARFGRDDELCESAKKKLLY